MDEQPLAVPETSNPSEIRRAWLSGKKVIDTADERTNFRTRGHRYSRPMLRVDDLPKEATQTIRRISAGVGEEEPVDVRAAAAMLHVEALFQIIEERPYRGSGVVENTRSLETMLNMIRLGAVLIDDMKRRGEQEQLVAAIKLALHKRRNYEGFRDALKKPDEQLLRGLSNTGNRALIKVSRLKDIIESY